MAKQIVQTDVTSTSVTVRITGLDTTYYDETRTIYWYINSYNNLYDTQSLSNGVSRSDPFTIEGLEPNKTYTILAEIEYWDATAVGKGYQLNPVGTRGQLDDVCFDYLYSSFKQSTGSLSGRITVNWTDEYGLWDLYSDDEGYVEYDGLVYDIDYQVMDGDYGIYAHYTAVYEVEPQYGAWVTVEADDDGLEITTEADRPAKFSWTYSKTSGGEFNLTATEWNRLTTNINAVRKYKGLSAYGFETASSGGLFKADMYNDAVWSLDAIDSGIWSRYLDTYESGDIIYAYYLNDLKDALNDIE